MKRIMKIVIVAAATVVALATIVATTLSGVDAASVGLV